METKADATHADLSADAKEKPPTEALPVGAVPKVDDTTKPVVTDESAAGGNKGVEQGFCGVRCEGVYLPVSGGKNSASGVWYWGDERNVRSDIEGATHVYFNVKVPYGNQSGFLSPAMPIKLADGSEAVYLAAVARRGVPVSCCVSDRDKSNVRLVPPSTIALLVAPDSAPDGGWVCDAVVQYLASLPKKKKKEKAKEEVHKSEGENSLEQFVCFVVCFSFLSKKDRRRAVWIMSCCSQN